MRRLLTFILLLIFIMALTLFPTTAQTLIPTFTPLPTFTPVATIPLLPTFTPYACFAPLSFSVGTLVALDPGVNVRNLPSLSGGIVNYYTEGQVLHITDGPVCASGYNWWRVEGAGNPGWVIEGRPGRYFLSAAIPTPDASAICFAPLALNVGGRTRAQTGVEVHTNPGMSSLVVTVAALGTMMDLRGGPVCADNVNWWPVRLPFNNTTITGWVAEGYPDNYWLAAEFPAATATPFCHRALRLSVGTKVGVTYSDAVARSLRAAPARSAALVERLIGGVALEITGSPICADGYNWWPVRILSTDITGWVAEGTPGSYWFDIIYDQPTPTPVDG
jgi:hypothetical protein